MFDIQINSESLQINPQGNSSARNVSVYLPPGYMHMQNQHIRYPVVYLLHGSYATNALWSGKGYLGDINLGISVDALIQNQTIDPMIIVMPDCKTKYNGSWYTNSEYTGNWETFITEELVPDIDENFRTIAHRNMRAVAGHSMGGYGAMRFGLQHAHMFANVYSTSGLLSLESAFLGNGKQRDKVISAHGAAWSPDVSNKDGYVLPWTGKPGERVKIPEVWRRWQAHDPMNMLNDYAVSGFKKRSTILIDCGEQDEPLLESNQAFSKRANQLGIKHRFETFEGGHHDKTMQRLTEVGLPFLSKSFAKAFDLQRQRHTPTETIARRVKEQPRNCVAQKKLT